MNKSLNRYAWAFIAIFPLLSSGCKRNAVDRLVDPAYDGMVPQTSGVYTIFDNELMTGGGLGLIPFSGNQSIDLQDQSDPRLSLAHVRYTWNGGDVYNPETEVDQHDFAGFHFLITPDNSTIDSATAKNLSAGGYTKLKMYVRGSLSENTSLRIEGPADGSEPSVTTCEEPDCMELSALSPSWQEVELDVTASRFSSVKFFMTISFQYDQPARTTAPGNGGVVYLDGIRYEQ